jgi:hypothetical protein
MPAEAEGFEPGERRADAGVCFPVADQDVSFPRDGGSVSPDPFSREAASPPEGVALWLPSNTRPVAAVHLAGDADWDVIAAWCSGEHHLHELGDSGEYEGVLRVSTRNGTVDATEGDWIVRDLRGLTVWEHWAFTCAHTLAGPRYPDPGASWLDDSAPGGVTRWKPRATVEAWQLAEGNAVSIADWISDSGTRCDQFLSPAQVIIRQAGRPDAKADVDDWIVRGYLGAFFVVPASEFGGIYEPVRPVEPTLASFYMAGVAAERARIRQLAIDNEAVCAGDEGTCCYFADLIREPS